MSSCEQRGWLPDDRATLTMDPELPGSPARWGCLMRFRPTASGIIWNGSGLLLLELEFIDVETQVVP